MHLHSREHNIIIWMHFDVMKIRDQLVLYECNTGFLRNQSSMIDIVNIETN